MSMLSSLKVPRRGLWALYLLTLGFICLAPAACSIGGGTCQTSEDCPGFLVCKAEQCTNCTIDTECSGSKRCVAGRCTNQSQPTGDGVISTEPAPGKELVTSSEPTTGLEPGDEPPIGTDGGTPETPVDDTSTCQPGKSRECYSGPAGTAGKGTCRAGTQSCTDKGEWGPCQGEVSPVTEVCGDGKDNDCNGKIDEAAAGCQCNPGETKECGSGTGTCQKGKMLCGTDAQWGACDGEVQPSQEICDGKDNDCDGQTDEDFTEKGKACALGSGGCQVSGQFVCTADGSNLECDATPKQATKETCDGKDNDCDGTVDEDLQRDCYTGPATTKGVGECKAGTQICNNGQWPTTCTGEVVPTKETCDGTDNDCDGTVDEGCQCLPGAKQACGTSTGACQKGSQTCSMAGQWGACKGEIAATKETCDGKDNDCDGQTDEDFSNKGKACSVGTGACKKSGTFVCLSDGSGLRCNATPGTSSKEVCDNIDNDCDGSIDESLKRSCYTGPAGSAGKGICKNGTQTCARGAWGACLSQVLPQKELCDGIDNDCDGGIDENFSNKGGPCTSGKGACLRKGTYVCNAAKTGTTCSAVAGKPTTELCDGIDNDCDGLVDENFTNKGKSCSVGKGVCLRTGTYVCNSAKTGTTCNATPGTASTEKCNKLDDDCDGQVDEGSFGPCSLGGCRGSNTCINGILQCQTLGDPTCCKRGQICP